jgi:hypothetical protein
VGHQFCVLLCAEVLHKDDLPAYVLLCKLKRDLALTTAACAMQKIIAPQILALLRGEKNALNCSNVFRRPVLREVVGGRTLIARVAPLGVPNTTSPPKTHLSV